MIYQIGPKCTIASHPFTIDQSPIKQEDINSIDKFAVFQILGSQHKVTIDDVVIADKIENIDIGQQLTFDEVFLVGQKDKTIIGRPVVPGAKVNLNQLIIFL